MPKGQLLNSYGQNYLPSIDPRNNSNTADPQGREQGGHTPHSMPTLPTCSSEMPRAWRQSPWGHRQDQAHAARRQVRPLQGVKGAPSNTGRGIASRAGSGKRREQFSEPHSNASAASRSTPVDAACFALPNSPPGSLNQASRTCEQCSTKSRREPGRTKRTDSAESTRTTPTRIPTPHTLSPRPLVPWRRTRVVLPCRPGTAGRGRG